MVVMNRFENRAAGNGEGIAATSSANEAPPLARELVEKILAPALVVQENRYRFTRFNFMRFVRRHVTYLNFILRVCWRVINPQASHFNKCIIT